MTYLIRCHARQERIEAKNMLDAVKQFVKDTANNDTVQLEVLTEDYIHLENVMITLPNKRSVF